VGPCCEPARTLRLTRKSMDDPSSPEQPTQGTAIVTARVFPFPREQVYAAFARPELLARWWGPKDFTNSFEVFEFRPGGQWKFVMHGPDGSDYANENVFVRLEEPSAVVIKHVSQPHFVLTVTLTAAANGGTEVEWEQVFEDSVVAEQIRHIVEPSNEQNLDRMTAVLEEGAVSER
jgi:uncharacterized protein YndB with AHSA1/START domain